MPPKFDLWNDGLDFQLIVHVQWIAKVNTLASIRNTWKQGSRLLRPNAQAAPILWDVKDPRYSHNHTKDDVWEAIAGMLGHNITGESPPIN